MKILRIADVKDRTGEGHTSIYAKMKRGEFPKSVKITGKSVGWIESEIEAYIAAKMATRDAKAA